MATWCNSGELTFLKMVVLSDGMWTTIVSTSQPTNVITLGEDEVLPPQEKIHLGQLGGSRNSP